MDNDNTFGNRVKSAWNAFFNRDPTDEWKPIGGGYSSRPDRPRLTGGNERSIITAIYNRIAIDVASINILHMRVDDNGRYTKAIDSELNKCITREANIDQTGRAFIQDVVMSMLDEGVIAIVPIDTTKDPNNTSSFDINTMRTGKITQWYPQHVKVRVYNDRTGEKEEITVSKNHVAIVENPLYSVMNERNSTAQRLVRKLNILDRIDEQSGSNKLDLIIQLPYVIKSAERKKQAEMRRQDIQDQLTGSQYGIAYTDGTEKITQLNRPIENNLLSQVQYLTEQFYGQLGITQDIMNGTAKEEVMLNYYNRTIEPIISAIADEMDRKFITRTARTQKQKIGFYRDPFKLVPITTIAEIADKFTRNEIATSNEIRQIIGMRPAEDPTADELRNKNLNQPGGGMASAVEGSESGMSNDDALSMFNQYLADFEADVQSILGGDDSRDDEADDSSDEDEADDSGDEDEDRDTKTT